jgi:PiT family inorganic phosphate transporter
MALGTSFGGWRIIRTVGMRIVKLRPLDGFAAETAAATVIQTASHLGLPVSTTHVISGSVMGVGARHRLSAVRWGVAGNMVVAWLLTGPATAILAAMLCALLLLLGRL